MVFVIYRLLLSLSLSVLGYDTAVNIRFFYSKVDSLLFIIGVFLGAHLAMAGCIGVQSICRGLVYVRCTIYSSSALDLALQ